MGKPILQYGKQSAQRQRSAFMTACGPTLGVLLAVPGILFCLVGIEAVFESSRGLNYSNAEQLISLGKSVGLLVFSVLCTIMAFRWIWTGDDDET